jgi:hypothetical protein
MMHGTYNVELHILVFTQLYYITILKTLARFDRCVIIIRESLLMIPQRSKRAVVFNVLM